MINSTIKFLLDILVLLLVIVVIVLSPIAAGGFAVLSVARYLLRRMYDMVTFNMIRCCARQPKEDSWVAWKVAGPGVSRNFYQTIK